MTKTQQKPKQIDTIIEEEEEKVEKVVKPFNGVKYMGVSSDDNFEGGEGESPIKNDDIYLDENITVEDIPDPLSD